MNTGITNTSDITTWAFLPSWNLNLAESFWPLIILSVFGLAFKNGLYIFMMRQFFKGVPDELEESAYIDGSGVFRTFFKIIIPLSIPMMVTVFLFAFSWQWTDNFYVGTTFFSTQKIYLFTHFIRNVDDIIPVGNTDVLTNYLTAFRNTAGLLILIPLIVVFLFCQRFLIQGIERSGITG